MDKIFNLLKLLAKGNVTSQREIANNTGFSLGMVNSLIQRMKERELIEVTFSKKGYDYFLTNKGKSFLENLMREQTFERIALNSEKTRQINSAVILAAGKSKSFDIPTGLLKINEEITIIERIVNTLQEFGIKSIYVVVGYKKELYYDALKDNDVQFIENNRYKWTGTMESLSLIKEVISDDFLIVEADHIFEKKLIYTLIHHDNTDCMVLTKPAGEHSDAYVELDKNGNLYKVSKDIHQLNHIDACLSGIHKISFNLFNKMIDYFKDNTNPYLNYEYVLENIARIYQIGMMKDDSLICLDINTEDQYKNALKVVCKTIKTRESNFDLKVIYKTFSKIMEIKEEDIEDISFAGGLTNFNYKVITNKETYILRMPGKCTETMISRTNEKYNSKLGYLLNINVDTIYFSETTGIKITKYVKNAETLNGQSAQLECNIRQTTSLLRNLHTSEAELKSTFKVEDELIKYEKIVTSLHGKFYEGYKEIRKEFFYFRNLLDEIGMDIKPCHNDLVAENLIKNKQRMYLIDWEYAGYNDPMWDLAAHLIECEFTKENEELFLNTYFEGKEITVENKKKILIFKILQDILWSVWTMAKESSGDDYGTYGVDRMNRAINLIKEYRDTYEC